MSSRRIRRLLVLDFDLAITDWDETLTRKRADDIATRLECLKKLGFKIAIVSLANLAHIEKTIQDSGSSALQKIMLAVEKMTIEDRRHLIQMDKTRRESIAAMRKLIAAVMQVPITSDTPLLPDWIYGYKKSNIIDNIRTNMKIEPSDVVFLDDNIFNIIFARHFGFRGFLVNNHPDVSYLNLLSILDWLIVITMPSSNPCNMSLRQERKRIRNKQLPYPTMRADETPRLEETIIKRTNKLVQEVNKRRSGGSSLEK